MAGATKVEISEYERKRQETIAKNQALLRELTLDAASAGLGPAKSLRQSTPSKPQRKKTERAKKEDAVPLRQSARLRGIVADSEVAKRKAEEDLQAAQEAERAKRLRISDDFNLSDIMVSGKSWDQTGNFLRNVGPARPYERTFTAQDVKETTDKDLKALREKMSGLQLWNDVEPNRIKITPERIYCMSLHPATDKAVVFAGDKMGNLGIFDGSQTVPDIKAEEDEDDEWEPPISAFKLHTRTISCLQVSPSDSNSLYSASYDSSIRKLDLCKGVAIEVYAPPGKSDEESLSGIEITQSDPNVIYFSTLEGRLGMHDMRAPPDNTGGTEIFQLSEKKIGGFSLHPVHSHLIATASLDRMLKIWDLRKIDGRGDLRLPALVGEHESRLSVSHAAFSSAGLVATASYDDTIKIHDFSNCADWKAGTALADQQMKPTTIIQHNNQTGRWVTILKPQWQLQPQDGVQRFCIGNMNRFVDIYTSKGQQLAQLSGEGITAVPAVARFHPTQDWVAAGTASGKLCLWM